MASFIFLFGFFSTISVVVSSTQREPLRLFIFGDSLVDNGNNNYIVSIAKADEHPNGIDFAPTGGRPTGRFTNGKTILDIIGDELGATCYPPSYLGPEANGAATLCGVNYASGGAGILNETGYIFGGRINMDAQIDNFANTHQYLITSLGAENASKLFEISWFPTVIGSNDFLDNYLVPIVSVGLRRLVSPEEFIEQMITRFEIQLRRLYSLNARKFIVINVGPIGCIPYQREVNPLSGENCVADSNQLVMSFNGRLNDLLTQLNSDLPEATFLYANVYNIVSDILQNSLQYGFEVIDSACCRVAGQYGGLIPCGAPSTYCPDRLKYFFWDPYHPTEAAYKLMAKRVLEGDNADISPMNLRQLFLL